MPQLIPLAPLFDWSTNFADCCFLSDLVVLPLLSPTNSQCDDIRSEQKFRILEIECTARSDRVDNLLVILAMLFRVSLPFFLLQIHRYAKLLLRQLKLCSERCMSVKEIEKNILNVTHARLFYFTKKTNGNSFKRTH